MKSRPDGKRPVLGLRGTPRQQEQIKALAKLGGFKTLQAWFDHLLRAQVSAATLWGPTATGPLQRPQLILLDTTALVDINRVADQLSAATVGYLVSSRHPARGEPPAGDPTGRPWLRNPDWAAPKRCLCGWKWPEGRPVPDKCKKCGQRIGM